MTIIGEQIEKLQKKKQDLNDACKKGNDDMGDAKQKFLDNTKHKSVLENTVDDLEMNLHKENKKRLGLFKYYGCSLAPWTVHPGTPCIVDPGNNNLLIDKILNVKCENLKVTLD